MTCWELPELGPFDPLLVARVLRLAWRIGAGVVQSHSYKPHLLAMAVRGVLRVPWVGHHHGWTAENDKVKRYHRVDGWSLPRADRVVAVAESARTIVVGHGVAESKVVLIPNAVDARDLEVTLSRDECRAKLGLPADATIACVVGRLSHEKGQDVALRALAILRDRRVSVSFAFAGDGPDRDALETLAKSLGVSDRAVFLGHQKTVGVVYRASDLLVMPSRSEAMPNALLEAMTLGLPAVATRVGGVPEVCDDGVTGWICAPESPESLAESVGKCLSDEADRRARTEKARAVTYEKHDPRRRAERYIALYEALLGRRLGPVGAEQRVAR